MLCAFLMMIRLGLPFILLLWLPWLPAIATNQLAVNCTREMSSDHPLGVVVVGVGIAGRVRIRDLVREAARSDTIIPGVKLIGYVSRRKLDIEGATQITFEEALHREDVHIITVSTENTKHEQFAREALKAGKHVLVEFPLALSADAGTDLYKIAKEKGVVCYEEDISLLTASHNKTKELIQQKGIKQIEMTLKGRPNGWVESDSPFVSGVSMLHRVLDLVEDVTPVEAFVAREAPNKFTAGAKLISKSSVPITLSYERSPDIERRQTGFSYTLGDDSIITDKSIQRLLPQEDYHPNSPGLFLKDFMKFVCVVQGKTDNTKEDKLTLEGLRLADQLYILAKGSAKSTNM